MGTGKGTPKSEPVTIDRVNTVEAVTFDQAMQKRNEDRREELILFLGRCLIASGILTRYNPTPAGLRREVDDHINALTS